MNLGKNESAKGNLGTGIVLKMTESLQNSYCMVLFDNFFNNLSLIVKLYERDLNGIDTAQKDRKGMPVMPVGRKKKRGDFEYLYSNKVACCK